MLNVFARAFIASRSIVRDLSDYYETSFYICRERDNGGEGEDGLHLYTYFLTSAKSRDNM